MRNIVITYILITLMYWIKLIWTFPGAYSKAYLLGRALVWPFIFLEWLFS